MAPPGTPSRPAARTITRCVGRADLPLGKMVCVGRNYAEHVREMGAERPEEPLLFLKPSTAYLDADGPTELVLPPWSKDVHHEVELVLRLGRDALEVEAEQALQCVDAFAVGIDLTARDVQSIAKRKGQPWAVAKGFDHSAPISTFQPLQDPSALADALLELEVDGVLRQRGRTSEMLFSLGELISFCSRRFRLEAGDLLFTGTPSGVGPLHSEEKVEARLSVDAPSVPALLCKLELRVLRR